ncbi:MAG: ATP-binding protein [Candidatus Parabeggiatoa sp.]|nr:ATP-binding protein [Candidatus Parabeggiatoa sp.]
MPYHVEIYGHAGAGKTILLAALHNIFPKPDGKVLIISNELENRFKLLAQHEFPGRTELGMSEYLVLELQLGRRLPPIELHITAHAGEVHTLDDSATENIKKEFLDNGKEKLLVVVVNPFLHNLDLAWKAFCNLVAVLQKKSRQGFSIKEACYAAAEILFHLSREQFQKYGLNMEDTLAGIEDAVLIYDCDASSLEERFKFSNVSNDNAKVDFDEEFKKTIASIFNAHKGDRDRLITLMDGLDNSMLILSHADLANKLSSISVDDFDEVFNLIFNTPNRNYRRQLLAGNLSLDIRSQEEEQVNINIRPVDLLDKSAKQFYENIKSFAIEAKTGKSLPIQANTGKSLSDSEVEPPTKLHWVTPEDDPLITVMEALVTETTLNREEFSKLVTATTNLVKEVELNRKELNPKKIENNLETISNGFSRLSMLEKINSSLTTLAKKLEDVSNRVFLSSIIFGIFIFISAVVIVAN